MSGQITRNTEFIDWLGEQRPFYGNFIGIQGSPTPTPSVTATLTPTPTITVTPTMTVTPTITPTPSSVPGTDEAKAYLNALVSASGSVGATASGATITLFTSLFSNNLYSTIVAMYPLLGEDAAGCKFNAVDPRDVNDAYRLKFIGGMTFASDGIAGNGTNAYAESYIDENTAASVATLGAYTLSTGNTGADIGNVTSYLIVATAGGSPYRALFQFGAGGTAQQNPSNGVGLYVGAHNPTSPKTRLFKNGTQVGTNVVGSTSFGTDQFYILAQNNGGSPLDYAARKLGFLFFAKQLSNAQVSTLSSIINTFMTTIGRNTY